MIKAERATDASTSASTKTGTGTGTGKGNGGATTPAAGRRRLDLVTVATWDNARLEDAMRRGVAPSLDALAGWEFNGYNTPQMTKLLGFRKFRKGFYRVPTSGAVHGYNVKVVQNGGPLDAWVPVERGGEPIKHGFYDVKPVDPTSREKLSPNAVLLDYASGRNPLFDPSALLRDYLVQVDPAEPDLFLGKAFLALGPARIFASYFILQRAIRTA